MSFYLAIGLSLAASLCWGANAHLVRIGMRGENHFHALFIRSLFTFPILFGVVLVWKGWEGLSIYLEDPILYYTLTSATLVLLGDVLFMIGLKKYTVNVMSPLTSTFPLFTAATLLITGQEALGPILLLGTVVVIAGVGIVTSNDITESFDRMALALGVGAALCWGISIVFVRLVLVTPGTDSMGLTGARMMVIGFSAILVYRIGLSTDRIEDTKETRGGSFKYMAWSGILGWVVGASLFFWAVQLIGAAVPTPISSTNPIVAALMGQILGIEQINFKQFTGIIVTVLGIIMIVLA